MGVDIGYDQIIYNRLLRYYQLTNLCRLVLIKYKLHLALIVFVSRKQIRELLLLLLYQIQHSCFAHLLDILTLHFPIPLMLLISVFFYISTQKMLSLQLLQSLSSSLTKQQIWFILKGKSLQSWLRNSQSIEISCDELSNVDLLEQSWPQLICYASYEPYGHNFREWYYKVITSLKYIKQ